MATQRSSDETRVRRLIEALVDAIRAEDLDGVMSLYADDVVSFDVEPPLQHVGAEAKRRNWARVDDWLIAHDQVSAPLDLESGRALLNLEP